MNLDSWKGKARFFNFQQHRIFYKLEGEGELLILIHGFPTASIDWCKVWPNLITQYQVLAFDMLGYGFSDKPKDFPYSIFTQADLLEELLAEIGEKTSIVLAHDKGDTVANELIARQNRRQLSFEIRACCFLNGGLFPGIHKPRPVQRALMTPFGKYIARLYSFSMFRRTFDQIFGPLTKASDIELRTLWHLMNKQEGMRIFHLLIRYMQDRIDNEQRWLKALQETHIPLRLIDGAADPISGKHMAEHYLKVIPNADVVLLENIGHYPQLEAPELVLEHFFAWADKIK